LFSADVAKILQKGFEILEKHTKEKLTKPNYSR
jgi:hypothetical protein